MELIQALSKVDVRAYFVTHFDFYKPNIRVGIISDEITFYKNVF